MKPKDIKAGMVVMVNPYPRRAGGDRWPDTSGRVICRRGGAIRFEPDEGQDHQLNVHCEQWSRNSPWTYRINVLDLVTIEGLSIKEFSEATSLPPLATPVSP